MEPTVSEMTVNQLREMISEVIDEKLRALADPDYGLELREEFVERLRQQVQEVRDGDRGVSLEDVLVNLGIDASEIESETVNVPASIS